jgi:1-acyl-sn-glycerol-3-phosphate acyltransferase
MKYLKKFVQLIYCVYALLWFILLMFLVLPFIIVFSIFGVTGGNLVYVACNIWGRAWYCVIGVRHKEIYEAPHDRKSQYIFVANHCSYMDIPAAIRCMHQPARVLGKYEMVKYPVFGWIYRAAVILVDRSSIEKRAKSVRALKAALKRGISIFIFPEGTFNETGNPLKEFYDGAFRIAIETQTPIKPLLFPDTIYRMHWRSLFELTPGRSRVVFMKEIPVHGYTLKQIQQLKQHVHNVMEEGLNKYRTIPLKGELAEAPQSK